jgi:hypothetical protein
MTSLFTPDVPATDYRVAMQQRDEQRRAEQARVLATQDQVRTETLLRSRSIFGRRSLLGSFGSGNSILGSG